MMGTGIIEKLFDKSDLIKEIYRNSQFSEREFRFRPTVESPSIEDVRGYHPNLFEDIFTMSEEIRAICESWEIGNASTGRTDFIYTTFVSINEDVRLYCENHGILEYLYEALNLINKHFESFQALEIFIEQDPETGEEWVNFNVIVAGGMEQILKSYSDYTHDWVAIVQWTGRKMFRLSYDII